ncbi:MAG: SDR family oxidoreductase [Candidatus Dormibacteraeota bacterium]|nr:SDR family oxidoreductase [Candidatus Dormibacteraeota bacterium]
MTPSTETTAMARGALGGKVAVVTGGGSGVGKAIAKALARQGASVVVADFDVPRMERAVEEVLKLGTSESAIALATDVRSEASVRSLVRDSIKAMGRVDILVNAAGVLLQGKLDKISSHDWTWMLDTNLLGPVRTVTNFLPHMSERGSGHIVNAVSYGGLLPGDPVTIPYDSGHAALAAFTEGLARHLKGTGVFVSLYCPGSKSPRIGQNTRSRGIGRWLGGADQAEDGSRLLDPLVTGLIESMHHPRFLILGDPDEAVALQRRWDHLDVSTEERREEGVSTRS